MRVHCLYTPYDAVIVPAQSRVLDGAASVHRVHVPAHHLVLRDTRVHDLVAQLLCTVNAAAATAHQAA